MLHCALEHHLATLGASAWAELDHVVHDFDGLRAMFHHQDDVALVPESEQQCIEAVDVGGMQASRRLFTTPFCPSRL